MNSLLVYILNKQNQTKTVRSIITKLSPGRSEIHFNYFKLKVILMVETKR